MAEPQARGGAEELDQDMEGDNANQAMDSAPFMGHGDKIRLVDAMREVMEAPETHRRRTDIVERAVRDNHMNADLAEYIYDLAEEEKVEPAFAFELVFAGLAVCELQQSTPDAEETLVAGAPEWVETPPLPDHDARRERRLRGSFRRLRHLMESTDPVTAAAAYAEYPDVDNCGY